MNELRIGEASAEVRASLRPIEWMVLEELALAAGVDEAGLLVATTSARAIGQRLGLTAGAVARALGRLRAQRAVDTPGAGGGRTRRGSSTEVEEDRTMTSRPQPALERPAARKPGPSVRLQPPRLDGGLQLELLSVPPSGQATRNSREHGR